MPAHGSLPFRLVASSFGAIIMLGSACAGELNEVDGVAIKGYDAVAYFTDHRAVPGSDAFAASYQGVRFKFASASHRDSFVADPASYLPQYGGFCAYGTATGHKADIDPEAFSIIDGKLYLNYSQDVRATWAKDIPGYIVKADEQWPSVSQSTEVYR